MHAYPRKTYIDLTEDCIEVHARRVIFTVVEQSGDRQDSAIHLRSEVFEVLLFGKKWSAATEMNEHSDLLIVTGAGASVDFSSSNSMPVGAELAEQIESTLRSELSNGAGVNGPISEAFARNGGYSGDHYIAMRRICEGIHSKDSIDDFIHEWSDFPHVVEVAKYCIAERILAGERGCDFAGLSRGSIQGTENLRRLRESWLGSVARLANPSVRRRDVLSAFNGIKFVTFNYDRCIEWYLYMWASIAQGMNDSEARGVVDSLDVLHVYGSVGDFLEMGGLGFGGDGQGLWRVPERIRTYNEEVSGHHIPKIRSIVSGAKKILFLGCAFHEQNIEILFGNEVKYRGEIWGTSLGMRPKDEGRARAALSAGGASVRLIQDRCAEFISTYYEEILPM